MTEKRWNIGDHVIYRKGKYRFPGKVTMRDDDGGVVVKAFGDASGNYTGMKHIYNDPVLEPYVFGDTPEGVPALVLFPDENPIPALRAYAEKHDLVQYKIILAGLDEWASVVAPDDGEDDPEPQARITKEPIACEMCSGNGDTLDGQQCPWCGGSGALIVP